MHGVGGLVFGVYLQVFSYFSVTNIKKKEKERKGKERKATQKHTKKGLPAFRCYSSMLVDTQKLVDSWGKFGKSCFSAKKIISTSERGVEHPFAGESHNTLV